jgi:hypothetical protein
MAEIGLMVTGPPNIAKAFGVQAVDREKEAEFRGAR